jgi:Kelch motif
MFATAAAAALAGAALASSGCGSSSTGVSAQQHLSATHAAQQRPAPRIVTKLEPYRLPTAVSGEAVTERSGELLVLGGLDSLDSSTSEIVVLPGGLHPRPAGALSEAKHDLAAVQLAGRTLVLGGGSTSELDAAEALSTQNSGTRVGTLPSARSDLSAVAVGGAAYVLGGYAGSEPIADVLRTTDGSRYAAIGRLPVPFRYAAAVVFGTKIYTFGGELASGEDTGAIQQIDTQTGTARVIGQLPTPVSHASAVVLGGKAYVLGGRSHGVALRRIVAFDPASGVARLAGRLPIAVTNAAAIESGSTGYLVGGIGSTEQTLDTVIAVRLVA